MLGPPGGLGMIRHRAILLGCALAVTAMPAFAEMLTGAQIRDLFTGNTIAGHYVTGGPFSEYHAADGRALGDNGLTLNVDACWNTDGDRVCYHYGPIKDRRTYCFTVERNGDNLALKVADTGRLNALATVEKGNPREHSDGGRRWSCDDLLAQRPIDRLRALARLAR
jgi:hypothetical protein